MNSHGLVMAISVSMSFNTVIAISYTARLQSVCHFRSSMTAPTPPAETN